MPTSRSPINRHGLLSRTYIPNQASHAKPTIEETKEWDEDELLSDDDLKVWVREAFQAGIKYAPPHPLVSTGDVDRTYQPHPDLYDTLAKTVLEHYTHYKRDEIDKTYIPTYFYLGPAGTGKSKHASEFVSSVQKAITLRTQHPLYHELAQRLKTAFVFHVSFKNETPLVEEDMSDLWNAIGVRMLYQLLGMPIDYIRSRYDADPRSVFRLVAAAENVDLYNDFTGIMVIDGIQKAFTGNNEGEFFGLLNLIASLGLMSRRPLEDKGQREAPFIMTCVTAACFKLTAAYLTNSHYRRVCLPFNQLDTQI